MNGYQIVSEVVDNPNVDMLIVKPYLYVYVERDKIDDVRKKGLSTGDGLQAFFTRLPESQYPEYLQTHTPVKISAAKLSKIKGQKVVIKPVNFDYPKDSLGEDDIQKILEKHRDKLLSMFKTKSEISSLPRVDIIFSDEFIPAFTIKVLDMEPNIKEMSVKKKIGAGIARMATNRQGRSLARDYRRTKNRNTIDWMSNMASSKAPKVIDRRTASKVVNKFGSAAG